MDAKVYNKKMEEYEYLTSGPTTSNPTVVTLLKEYSIMLTFLRASYNNFPHANGIIKRMLDLTSCNPVIIKNDIANVVCQITNLSKERALSLVNDQIKTYNLKK